MLVKETERLKPGKDWEEKLDYSSIPVFQSMQKKKKKKLCYSAFTRDLLSFCPENFFGAL